jgi:hypothetical protein
MQTGHRFLAYTTPVPPSLHVSVEAGKWFVSFSSDDGLPESKDEDTVAWLVYGRGTPE